MIRKKTLRQGNPFLLVEHSIIQNSQHATHLERMSICGYGLQEGSSQADSWCNVQTQGGGYHEIRACRLYHRYEEIPTEAVHV